MEKINDVTGIEIQEGDLVEFDVLHINSNMEERSKKSFSEIVIYGGEYQLKIRKCPVYVSGVIISLNKGFFRNPKIIKRPKLKCNGNKCNKPNTCVTACLYNVGP